MADAREAPLPSWFDATAAAIAGVAFAIGAVAARRATLLPSGFFDALAIVCLALGLSVLAHRLVSAAAATLLRGAGLAVATLLTCAALVTPFERAGPPLAAWIAGGAMLQAATRARRSGIVLHSLGLILLAAGGAAAWVLAPGFPEAARLRWATLAVGALWAAGLAARAMLLRSKHRAWAPGPLGILLVSALACVYVAYRPLVGTKVANLPLYEWTLGVSAALLLLGRMRRQARDDAVPEAWSSESRRHTQDVVPAYDARMGPIAAAIHRYLDRGEGFDDYVKALARAGEGAPAAYRKALQGLRPVPPRARGGARERRATHDALMTLLQTEAAHGHAPPALR